MEGFSSYQNNANIKEHDFNKLTQTGSSIQKISQNGKKYLAYLRKNIILFFSSIFYSKNGPAVGHFTRFQGTSATIVSNINSITKINT